MTDSTISVRVPFDGMKREFERVLVRYGFTPGRAAECAEIFAVNTLEGVASHGVNRFPRFIKYIREGLVVPDAVPVLIHSSGSIEQWDGKLGPGPLNAIFATERAAALAKINGIGLAALSNTNHWMRGGSYGWHAARQGFIFAGWTNTEANMPAWGASDARLGNNPLIFAVPFENEAVVLDFAMTQFSYGKMESYRLAGEKLPFKGGYDSEGNLTDNPAAILETRRTLPIGYWKGAGLSLLLEILAVVLSGGLSVGEITANGTERSLSQVFIAIDPRKLVNYQSINDSISKIINYCKGSSPSEAGTVIRYPGENIIRLREKYLLEGIPVNRQIWEEITRF